MAAPLSQAKKISMVADGSGEIGAAKLTAEVLQIMNSVPMTVKNMTGVDISATLSRGGMGASRVSVDNLEFTLTYRLTSFLFYLAVCFSGVDERSPLMEEAIIIKRGAMHSPIDLILP